MKNREGTDRNCPMETAIDVLSGKWKISIVWNLYRGPKRFNELQRILCPITQKTLTSQLRELESDGIVSRKAYPEIPPRVEYSLTETGSHIKPAFRELLKWGIRYRKSRVEAGGSTAENGNAASEQ
ncbi:MAG TPA: helix-turn-helix domain-containing protein [Clostridia bacterium]|nr:helix-turn-helix domain-containing protein [Clostridia bacterium]